MVVGAGLAGAAICERLCSRGWEVELVERHARPAEEASGNPAGAFHPVVTPDDSIFARITRAGFLSSLRQWKSLPRLRWDQCGLLQLARDEREAASQARSVGGLPAEYAQSVTREEATAYFEAIAAGLRRGSLLFRRGEDQLALSPAPHVEVQVKASGKEHKAKVSFELSWSTHGPSDLEIS